MENNRCLAVSQLLADALNKHAANTIVEVLGNNVDENFFTIGMPSKSDAFIFSTVAKLAKNKGSIFCYPHSAPEKRLFWLIIDTQLPVWKKIIHELP